MGTKNEPGNFDCYSNAKDDEPMFVLLARDADAWALVNEWADRRAARGEDRAKVQEARDCAAAMHAWRLAHKCTDRDCRHSGAQHEAGGCRAQTLYGECDCYGFVPDLALPIAAVQP